MDRPHGLALRPEPIVKPHQSGPTINVEFHAGDGVRRCNRCKGAVDLGDHSTGDGDGDHSRRIAGSPNWLIGGFPG